MPVELEVQPMAPFKMTFEIDFGAAGKFRGSMDVVKFDTRRDLVCIDVGGMHTPVGQLPAYGTITAANIVMEPIP